MNPVNEDMKDVIVAAGYGTFGTDLFVGVLPDTPNLCVALIESGSWREPEPNPDLEYPTMQVLVRGGTNEYLKARDKMEDIYAHLRDIGQVTVGTTFYGGVWCSSGPTSIGRDERERPVFSANFRFMRSTT